ncbi:MAG: hypothetical protein E7236_04700 [Lachnospiraceae bacterium]|jgi:hypothetical protein|nr:hypothetical protein [Lachnospiraceae bacterium]
MKARKSGRYKSVTAVLSIAAVGLLALGSVGGARAALTYSDTYQSQVETQNIAVSLTENGTAVEGDEALLQDLQSEPLHAGEMYEENLSASNDGEIDAFVRLTVHKYWEDDSGKRLDLSPELILMTVNEDDWLMVDDDPDDEIVQLYSINPVAAGDALTAVEEMGVDSQIAKMVKQTYTKEGKTTTITTTYKYDGFYIGLDVDVDAVQTHNAEDAILSAWGVNAAGADSGTITGIN